MLGTAFPKVNFLRDLSADFESLGRSYFPGARVESFSEEGETRLLEYIVADLCDSAALVPPLPATSRRAVALAQGSSPSAPCACGQPRRIGSCTSA